MCDVDTRFSQQATEMIDQSAFFWHFPTSIFCHLQVFHVPEPLSLLRCSKALFYGSQLAFKRRIYQNDRPK